MNLVHNLNTKVHSVSRRDRKGARLPHLDYMNGSYRTKAKQKFFGHVIDITCRTARSGEHRGT